MTPAANLHASVQPNSMREPHSRIKRDRLVIAFNCGFEFPHFPQDIAAIEVRVSVVGVYFYSSIIAGERRVRLTQRLLHCAPVAVSLRIVGLDCNDPLVACKSVLQVSELDEGQSYVHMRGESKFVLRVASDGLSEEFQRSTWVISLARDQTQ